MRKRMTLTPPQKITPLYSQSNNYIGSCRGCRKLVEMITFREAVQIVGIELNELIKHAAKGSLHLGIRPEALLICLESLLQTDFQNAKELAN